MNKQSINYSIILLLFVLFTSCNSYKKVPYFQDINRAAIQTETIDNLAPIMIQPNDVLTITVTSLNVEASNAFNGATTSITTSAESVNTQDKGYLVDQNGNILLPLIGTVKVGNLTTIQVHDIILTKLLPFLKEPNLMVKLANFKFSVTGDVNKPGMFVAPKEKLNLVEALSIAGDLNITAKRENILIIREVNGKREFATLDLTNSKLFHSAYYYLKNNDIIYVEPDKTKYTSVSTSRSNITLGLSLVSIAALIVSILRR